MSDEFAAEVAGVAALSEPVRRTLYRYVIAQDRPVSREDAAAGVGVAHHVAKFNLDRLVADGLLDVEYRRPAGRSGPGAGRPTKLYRRGAREISVSLPERHYELAGQVMAEALTIAARNDLSVPDAIHAAARAAGQRLADTVEPADMSGPADLSGPAGMTRPGDMSGSADAAGAAHAADAVAGSRTVSDLLASLGYEPRTTDDGVILGNCPFHHLSRAYTELVCGMNLDLIEGALDHLCPGRLEAHLEPGPNRCCVVIRAKPGVTSTPG